VFTGIIERVGQIVDRIQKGRGFELLIDVGEKIDDLKIGESIAVDGACLTLTKFSESILYFDVSPETVRKTVIGYYKKGDFVNIERALRLQDRLGGHIVLGHVDTIGTVIGITKETEFFWLSIKYPITFSKYVALKGSIAVNGISLTVAEKEGEVIKISVIPHTYNVTSLKYKKIGDPVNLEFDIIARYIESIVSSYKMDGDFEKKLREFLGG
jgi:riboflavin synthase